MQNYNFKFKKVLSVILLFILSPSVVFAAGLVPSCGTSCGFNEFIQLIQNVINFLMFDVAAPLAAIAFAIAGIIMFTAGGSPEKIKQAKEIFYYVFIGIFVALAGWLIVSTIMGTLLGSSIADFVKNNFLNF
jgi:hypothetical protein